MKEDRRNVKQASLNLARAGAEADKKGLKYSSEKGTKNYLH